MRSVFRTNSDGNVALIFALVLPLLLAFVGAGVDYARYAAVRAEIQEIADGAAIAGARQYLLSKDGNQLPEAIAKQAARNKLDHSINLASAVIRTSGSQTDSTVQVEIDYAMTPSFLVGVFRNPLDVNAVATAQASGSANICIITLEPSTKETLSMTADAKITGAKCAVYVNSTNQTAIGVYNFAKISTALTCSSGGFGGTTMNYAPAPLTDCPPRGDPLAERTPPTIGACDHSKFSVKDFVGVLQPGVYCGGLTILGNSDVEFAKGIYVIKDGDMEVLGASKIFGEEVGFYFSGNGADLFMNGDADVSLSAPITGPMAGILIWQDPLGKTAKVFEVASNNVKTLVGTIYLPKGKFLGRANAPVAQSSAYTAIIANKIELLAGVNLVLNTNYGQTPVPVPAGLGGSGGQVSLRQ
jgi:Flp pilus assembly protein TadG